MAKNKLSAILLVVAILIDCCQCNVDEEFKTMILERMQLQDEKNQQQDEKIANLESENSILASKLELYQTQFQSSLNAAETRDLDCFFSSISLKSLFDYFPFRACF